MLLFFLDEYLKVELFGHWIDVILSFLKKIKKKIVSQADILFYISSRNLWKL